MLPRTTRARRTLLGALVASAAATGCGGGPPAPTPTDPAGPDECLVGGGDRVREGPLLPAGGDPEPGEPPVRLDCLGRPRPGLATTWSSDSAGRAWTLRFERVAAGEVADAWRTSSTAAAALRWSGAESVVPLDAERLVVSFSSGHDSLPLVFADPALGLSGNGASDVRPFPDSGDARDAIDRGADVIRTADPEALEYASSRPGLTVAPLPWDLTYALILPAHGAAFGSAIGRDTAGFRKELAENAVEVEARGAAAPFWWETASCAPGVAQGAAPGSPAVVYSSADPVARALAERIVALSKGRDAVARGVGPAELPSAIRSGGDRAYVVALPRRALVPCREMASWPPGSAVVGLIDTRDHLILRDGVGPLEVDHDGGLRPRRSP